MKIGRGEYEREDWCGDEPDDATISAPRDEDWQGTNLSIVDQLPPARRRRRLRTHHTFPVTANEAKKTSTDAPIPVTADEAKKTSTDAPMPVTANEAKKTSTDAPIPK